MSTDTEPYWLPDFELAVAEKFDPAVFLSGDGSVHQFVLMLALIFNDLKSLHWFAHQTERGNGNKTGAVDDLYQAQVNGVRDWINRQMISALNELLVLVSKSDDVIESPEFQKCLEACPPNARARWSSIAGAAEKQQSQAKSSLGRFLRFVRNNVGYHYEHTELLRKGYQKHFVEFRPLGVSEFAYASLGNTLETTRFFFADAASQALMRRVLDPTGELFDAAGAAVLDVNVALRSVVEHYLRLRSEQLGTSTAPAAGGP
jgi:hypothetical protein